MIQLGFQDRSVFDSVANEEIDLGRGPVGNFGDAQWLGPGGLNAGLLQKSKIKWPSLVSRSDDFEGLVACRPGSHQYQVRFYFFSVGNHQGAALRRIKNLYAAVGADVEKRDIKVSR